ncbi:MAG: hypothetical protein WBE13_04290 [Candidatus Acidiferrum sp.]
MNPSLPSLDSIFQSIVLATLAIGLPILFVLAIRFLWDPNLKLNRSKDIEKLIWQLHRIASALEHQLSLPSTPIRPGTEEPRDVVYLQQLPTQPIAPASSAATLQALAAAAAASSTGASPAAAQPPAQQAGLQQPAAPAQPSGQQPPRAGVNSMFGM